MKSLREEKCKLWVLLFFTFTFVGCSTPVVEKKYDEIEKKTTCRLYKFRTRGPINIALDTLDDGSANFLFSVNSLGYLTNMHQNPKVLFKIYNGQTVQELPFQGSSKNWIAESVTQLKADKDVAFSPTSADPFNHDYASISISKSDFLRIAHADKVEVFVQTNRDPVKAELHKEELAWFLTFDKMCLEEKTKKI